MDMGGMDMGTSMFQDGNKALAHTFWYLIAGVLGGMLLVRLLNLYKSQIRLRRLAGRSINAPTKPSNQWLEWWATLTAVCREVGYPQLQFPVRYLSWLTPPSLGRCIFLLAYWAVIIYMSTADAIVADIMFWERIAFRNAWTTIMQVPLLYLLASKCSILSLLSGISYERLNWLHRWVGRTVFITATVHGWHFYSEFQLGGILDLEFEMMPMIKYGLGAWAVLLWILVSSFAPLRRLGYEFFVLQHLLSAILFLWLIYVHVPVYAQYNIWFAIAALCFDRTARTALLLWQNVKVMPNKSKCKGGQRIGHQAQVRAMGNMVTVMTIKDVHFKWRPGQHLYLWAPKVGPLESHPYTIACAHTVPETCICNSIQLVIRTHSGFSRRLHEYAAKAQASDKKETLTVFVAGPYGEPPRWDIYETLVLISASTGASFTLPILEGVLHESRANCVKRVFFLLAAKQGEEIEFYLGRLQELLDLAQEVGIELVVHVAVTQGGSHSPVFRGLGSSQVLSASRDSTSISGLDEKGAHEHTTASTPIDIEAHYRGKHPSSPVTESVGIRHSQCRPDIENFIRDPVEMTAGETSVVVCGGQSLVSRVRNCVAALSDERAVHKGTGAQGIHLHVEEYCF